MRMYTPASAFVPQYKLVTLVAYIKIRKKKKSMSFSSAAQIHTGDLSVL